MNYTIDAHSHLPKDGKLSTLLDNMNNENVEKLVLILNSKEEFDVFKKEINIFKLNSSRFGVLLGLDYRNFVHIQNIDFLNVNNIHYGIKLHSRYTNITKNDFDKVIKIIHSIKTNVILVDSFPYGADYKTHIGIELSIELANAFKNKKIILAHSGGIDLLKCMLLTRSLSNVFYDLSLTVPYLFNTSIHADIIHFIRYTSNRIMYGSDYPDFTIQNSKSKFMDIIKESGIDENSINNIMYKNALEIYSSLWNV
ncbi:MAG: amidohydrolase family protein [Christensenellaceae bacterium]|nr:amidohydrolase family protein [Christensenellaceae bacterium]